MTTIPVSPEALDSIKRMTQKLTEDNKMLLDALKQANADLSAANLAIERGYEDEALLATGVGSARAERVIAKAEAQPAVMEKP